MGHTWVIEVDQVEVSDSVHHLQKHGVMVLLIWIRGNRFLRGSITLLDRAMRLIVDR